MLINKPYLFVSFKSWKKTEKETIKSFINNGKNTVFVPEPAQNISLIGVGKPTHNYVTLRNQLEVKSDPEFPLSMSRYQVTIEGRKEEKLPQKIFVYDLSVSDGSKVILRKEYRCKNQWSFFGLQSLIKAAEERSRVEEGAVRIDSLNEPSIVDFRFRLTYKNGILRFEDPLGEGAWSKGTFAPSSELIIAKLAASGKLNVEAIFEDVFRLIIFSKTQSDPSVLTELLDTTYLRDCTRHINEFTRACAESSKDSKYIRSSEVSKLPEDLINDEEYFLTKLIHEKSSLYSIEKFCSNNFSILVDQFCSIDAFKNKDLSLSDPKEDAKNQDAKADGYIWRVSSVFNDEISKLCNALINSAISKRNIRINDPFNHAGDIMFDLMLTHDINEHTVQLLRQSISFEGSAIFVVVKEKSSNVILLWQKLTTSMPPQSSFGIIEDSLFYLHSDSTDPTRTFETKSINLSKLISEATKKDIYSVASMNNETVSWDQGNSQTIGMAASGNMLVTINYQYDLCIWNQISKDQIAKKDISQKIVQYKFSKEHPPTECLAFVRIINPKLILVILFKEFAFKTFLVSPKAAEDGKSSYQVLDKYETLFDAAVDNEEGGSKSNKPSTLSQNCLYPFHYPILIKRAVGHLLILPYKILDFELLFISENIQLLHLATKAKNPKLLFAKLLPDVYSRELKDGKPVYKAIDGTKKLYESYFSADSTDPSRINIVVVKKQKDKTPESIRVIRCMLKI